MKKTSKISMIRARVVTSPWGRWLEDPGLEELGRNSAWLAFTSLFAMVPMLVVSAWVVGRVPGIASLSMESRQWMLAHVLPESAARIGQIVEGMATQANSLGGVGVALLFLTCVWMIRRLEQALNAVWHVKEDRSGWHGWLAWWGALIVGPLLLMTVVVVATSLLSLRWLSSWWPDMPQAISLSPLVPWGVTTVLLGLTYRVLPNTSVRWQHGMTGAAMAAALLEMLRHGLSAAVKFLPSWHLMYGAFIAIPVFLVWLQSCWVIVLIGATIARDLQQPRGACP